MRFKAFKCAKFCKTVKSFKKPSGPSIVVRTIFHVYVLVPNQFNRSQSRDRLHALSRSNWIVPERPNTRNSHYLLAWPLEPPSVCSPAGLIRLRAKQWDITDQNVTIVLLTTRVTVIINHKVLLDMAADVHKDNFLLLCLQQWFKIRKKYVLGPAFVPILAFAFMLVVKTPSMIQLMFSFFFYFSS